MIGQSLGRYRILEEIGCGGMGVVYRARDDRLERDVALKVLPKGRLGDETARKRFRKEAKALSKLNHPNIATVHDLDTEGGVDFLVMEYISGETLEKKLTSGALEEKEVVRLGVQLAEGLVAAHEQGVIHRDLKPGNLRVTSEGRMKILDFGLALLLRPVSESAITDSSLTEARAAVGTLPYMAPEQLRGEVADARTDLYAAGVVLYEMATGRRPFPETRGPLLISAILTQSPPAPSEVNPYLSSALERMILKALDKKRDRRYQSANELLEELQQIGSPALHSRPRPTVSSPPFLEKELARPARPVFVAREDELARLGAFLDKSLSGQGQVIFVAGEAGTGKTALVSEFVHRSQEAHADLVVANGNCNAHTGVGDPYLPFREVLALLTGEVEARWRAGAISSDHAQRLWHCFPVSVQSLVESGPDLIDTFVAGRALVGRARSFEPGGSAWLGELQKIVERKAANAAPTGLRQSVLFEQYARVLQTLASQKPVLLVLDDLQWADGGSIGLLLHLADQIQASRVLIVGTCRSDEVALGRGGDRHPLKPVINECKRRFGNVEVELGEVGSRGFVEALLDTEPNRLDSLFREALYRQTQGHPLFTVELLRRMEERGDLVRDQEGRWTKGKVLDWDTLPARVEAMIEERIERLPANVRELLGAASVEGQVFAAEVLSRVQESDERDMLRLLSKDLDKRYHLVRAQGTRRVGRQRISQFQFRHILFQKYLYNRLDEVERVVLHEDVGKTLEELYGEQKEEIAVHLAHHFQKAGITEKAIEYLGQAGNKAVRLSANEEATAHFSKGLQLLETLPVTPERDSQELALQLGMAAMLQARKGFGAPEVLTVCARARQLCQQVGETPQTLPALWFLSSSYGTRAEYGTALDLAKQYLSISERIEDPQSIAMAHWALGFALIYMGEPLDAHEHFELVIGYYDHYKPRSLAFLYGFDPGVACLSWAAQSLWLLGYPDQALKRSREAHSLALELGHTHTLAFSLAFAKLRFYINCRELHEARESLQELIQISKKEKFPFYLEFGRLYRGWFQVHEGQVEEGIEQMLQANAATQAIGSKIGTGIRLARLAEAYLKAERLEEATNVLTEALSHVEKTGERFHEPEIHCLRGELLLMKGVSPSEAEPCFHRAIDAARRQKAKSWELRAVTSLARLWQKQGKERQARQRLAETYEWFAEGFDTPDLKAAKALLEELS